MLVLSRTVGQKFLIYRNGELLLEIYLTEIRGESVRLGFDRMPDDVRVMRGELESTDERAQGEPTQERPPG